MDTPQAQYSLIAKAFHWGVMAIFAYGIAKQVDDVSDLQDRALLIFELQFALVFLVILGLRYVYMTKTQSTALPADTPAWQKYAAHYVHKAMYLSLAGIAVTGLMIGLFFYLGFQQGLVIHLLAELHGITVSAAYYLIALHVLASIYHRLKKDGVWSAMVPFVFTETHVQKQPEKQPEKWAEKQPEK